MGSMQAALEQFRALSARALAGAKAAPELSAIEPMMGRGWVLVYELGGAGGQVHINALPEPAAAAKFNYSYRVPEHSDPRRAKQLGRAGLLLCRALGRVVPEFEPSVPTELEDSSRESLGLYLLGVCDRACVFCAWTYHGQRHGLDGQRLEGGPRLPVLSVADFADHDWVKGLDAEQIEAELRAHAHEAASYRVSWSGPDCLASPYFDDGLRLAYELGYREMAIQSPGTRLLEPGFLDFLAAHSVTEVSLTAHARDAALFDEVGGKPGAYRLFWDAVDALHDREFAVYFEVPCIAETVEDLPAHLAELARFPGPLTVFFWYPSSDMLDFFPRMGMSFERALAALERARELLEPGRVTVDGIPRCVVPDELAEHYVWTYSHMVFFECERLELCASCSLREECPGAAPVYLENHAWPADARPLP